jgi:DNA-binding winged helix-turn-helix (wHTH) protein
MLESQETVYEFDNYCLDPLNRSLKRASSNDPIFLKPKCFDLLLFLVENSEKLVTVDDILRHVWGDPGSVEETNVRTRIHHIRKALGDDPKKGKSKFIQTSKGSYTFVCSVNKRQRHLSQPPPTTFQTPIISTAIDGQEPTAAIGVIEAIQSQTFSQQIKPYLWRGLIAALILVSVFMMLLRRKQEYPFQITDISPSPVAAIGDQAYRVKGLGFHQGLQADVYDSEGPCCTNTEPLP